MVSLSGLMYNRHYCRIKKNNKKQILKSLQKNISWPSYPLQMPSGFCLAASCLDWDRRKRLCTGAGEGARVRDRRVQAPPSGNSLPSLAKTAPGWADCALTHGWGLAIAPRKDSWKDRSLFRSDVPPGQTRWHGPGTQHPGDAQHPVLFLHPTWWAAPSPYWASGLEVKGTIRSKLYWALHVP